MAAPFRLGVPAAASASTAPHALSASILSAPSAAHDGPGLSGLGSSGHSVPAAARPAEAPAPAAPSPAPATPLQGYWERLVKLIPAEIVGMYLIGVGVIPKGENVSLTVWAVICLALVVIVRAYGTGDTAVKLPPEWGTVFVSSVSFVIWVYNMPGPFQVYGIAVPYIGSLAVLVWTFVVPIFYKGSH
jgi:hypothetical protein